LFNSGWETTIETQFQNNISVLSYYLSDFRQNFHIHTYIYTYNYYSFLISDLFSFLT
jgi:hypothetical protein